MPKTNEIIKSISESKESIRNNSKMIMKIEKRVYQLKDKIDDEPKVVKDVT